MLRRIVVPILLESSIESTGPWAGQPWTLGVLFIPKHLQPTTPTGACFYNYDFLTKVTGNSSEANNVMKTSIQCLPLATILTALMPGFLSADELRVADVFTDHAVE